MATLNTMANSWLGKARIGLEYAFKRSGPMSMAPSQLGAFTRSSPEQPYPNIEYHVQPLSLDAFGEPLHGFNAFTASVCNLNPTSRGTVHIRSNKFEDAPRDRAQLSEHARGPQGGGRLAARHAPHRGAAGAGQVPAHRMAARHRSSRATRSWRGSPATSPPRSSIRSEPPRWARDDDPMAVLDSQLRVRGIAGLRVVDAGAMPTITSGNTNSPTLMMAEKAADWILKAARSGA